MADLIVHIGTFKTGTTALQKHLARFREELLTQESLLFPRAGEIPAGGHHNLVYEITRSWKYVAERGGFEALKREIAASGASKVLISAENLSSYALGNEKVAASFGDFAEAMGMRIRVVCYVRPQWEYIDSYYSQGVKSGYTTCSFSAFVEAALGDRMYDYEKVVFPWMSLTKDICIRPYPGREFIGDFMRLIGASNISSGDAGGPPRRNERFGAKRLELMRRFGAALERAKLPLRTRIPLAHRLRDCISKIEIDDVPFSGLDANVVQRIHDNFVESNARLSHRFGMDPSWCMLPSRAFQPTVFDMRSASRRDMDALDDAVAHILLNRDSLA